MPIGFDLAERERDAGSRPFKQPVPKKIVPINLYNPHAEAESDNKCIPGPGKYDVPSAFSGFKTNEDS